LCLHLTPLPCGFGKICDALDAFRRVTLPRTPRIASEVAADAVKCVSFHRTNNRDASGQIYFLTIISKFVQACEKLVKNFLKFV
jgi:hypothetical protein